MQLVPNSAWSFSLLLIELFFWCTIHWFSKKSLLTLVSDVETVFLDGMVVTFVKVILITMQYVVNKCIIQLTMNNFLDAQEIAMHLHPVLLFNPLYSDISLF